jgi:hypothetical protein
LEDSVTLIEDHDSKYVKLFREKKYKKENTLHIPISTYSYTVEEWKEMFFMNDMNHVLMNMIMITPFIDILYYHRGVLLSLIFKNIFKVMSSIDTFYSPIYNNYLTPMAEGKFWNKSWRQFEVGPVAGAWSIYSSYAWLWCENRNEIYNGIRSIFKDEIDELLDDCLVYCENSTFGSKNDIIWENKWRWDLWEEVGDRTILPKKENVKLITKSVEVPWNERSKLYRNNSTYRADSREPIRMKMFQLSRAGND